MKETFFPSTFSQDAFPHDAFPRIRETQPAEKKRGKSTHRKATREKNVTDLKTTYAHNLFFNSSKKLRKTKVFKKVTKFPKKVTGMLKDKSLHKKLKMLKKS